MKFRKKPVVIEAIQFTREMFEGKKSLPKGVIKTYHYQERTKPSGFGIKTLEGIMEVRIGDWIIKGIKGEQYSCKPDIFEATYEPIASQPMGKTNG